MLEAIRTYQKQDAHENILVKLKSEKAIELIHNNIDDKDTQQKRAIDDDAYGRKL